MLTVRETSARLSLSVTKTYEILRKGGLPHYRIGGAIRIAEPDLAAFLDTCRRECDDTVPRAPRPRLKLKHIKL
jgi:excisionase family DNA binding protein